MSDIGHQYTLMLCWAIFMPSSKFWEAFFMDAKDISFIQDQIGYNFKNTDLLQQAFVRRSYSHENGGEVDYDLGRVLHLGQKFAHGHIDVLQIGNIILVAAGQLSSP